MLPKTFNMGNVHHIVLSENIIYEYVFNLIHVYICMWLGKRLEENKSNYLELLYHLQIL